MPSPGLRTRVPPAVPGRAWSLGLLIGAVAGLGILWMAQGETRWAVYGVIGLVLLGVLPFVVRWVGSLERLLLIGLVLSLQLEVAWAPVHWGYAKPAGPYGILVSPALIAAAMLLVVRLATTGWSVLLHDRRLVGLLALFFLAGVVSAVNATDKNLTAYGLFEVATLGLIAIVVCDAVRSRRGLATVEDCLAWTLVLQSLLIVVGFASGVQLSLSHGVRGEDYGWSDMGRFSGTLGTPSAASTLLVFCLLSLMARLAVTRASVRRSVMLVEVALGLFALLLTQTRTAWIGLLIGGAGMGGALMRRGLLPRRLLVRLLAFAIVAGLVAWPFISARVSAHHTVDAEIRYNLFLNAIEMIKAHPFAGVGLNTATSVVHHYAALAGVGGQWVFIVHNQFMLVWAETGLLGIVAFVGLFVVALGAARRAGHVDDQAMQASAAWAFWSTWMFVWALNLDQVAGGSTYKLVFLAIGLACGLGKASAACAARRELGED